MSQQDRTLDRYQELMQINAASHVLRAARQIGVFAQLRHGQRTAEQLAESLQLDRVGLDLLLDCLISMNVIERYQDDHALAPVMQLLCQYDADLGDPDWGRLTSKIRNHQAAERSGGKAQDATTDRSYLDALAATQWVHTPAAMQAAEMLDIGAGSSQSLSEKGSDPLRRGQKRNENDSPPKGQTPFRIGSQSAQSAQSDVSEVNLSSPLRILDLGCGSAVWSCAIAFRDTDATILAVDQSAALAAAQNTADSIQLGARFKTLAADPQNADLPAADFDLVVLAQRLHAASDPQRGQLLDQAIVALAPGGRLVLIDLFRGPTQPRLSETLEALRIHVATAEGRMQSAQELKASLSDRGLSDIQFTFIAASRVNLGMIVARKPQ